MSAFLGAGQGGRAVWRWGWEGVGRWGREGQQLKKCFRCILLILGIFYIYMSTEIIWLLQKMVYASQSLTAFKQNVTYKWSRYLYHRRDNDLCDMCTLFPNPGLLKSEFSRAVLSSFFFFFEVLFCVAFFFALHQFLKNESVPWYMLIRHIHVLLIHYKHCKKILKLKFFNEIKINVTGKL